MALERIAVGLLTRLVRLVSFPASSLTMGGTVVSFGYQIIIQAWGKVMHALLFFLLETQSFYFHNYMEIFEHEVSHSAFKCQ